MLGIISKENWNNFILANGGSFLQSFEWGEFQEKFGRKVFRFLNCHPEFISGSQEVLKQVQDDKIEWQAQFIEYRLPFGKKYWYAPRGPVFSLRQAQAINNKEEYFLSEAKRVEGLIEKIKGLADKSVIFFRIGPEWGINNCHPERSEGSKKDSSAKLSLAHAFGLRMTKEGFKQLHYDIEPSQTLILDIVKPEEELLAEMHEKWRYNIRLAERKGVKIKMVSAGDGDFEKYFEEFYRLVSEGTSARHQIKHHPKEYYRKQLEINSENNSPQPSLNIREGGNEIPPLNLRGGEGELKFHEMLFIAEYENKVIAANIVVIFGQTATYLHGATDNNFRNLMAPHLLQWEQIKYARTQGCAKYDFFGISNEHTLDKRGASWEGFTRFKKGFGGREENYIGYFDYPMNKFWYFIYRLVQKFRR